MIKSASIIKFDKMIKMAYDKLKEKVDTNEKAQVDKEQNPREKMWHKHPHWRKEGESKHQGHSQEGKN